MLTKQLSWGLKWGNNQICTQ